MGPRLREFLAGLWRSWKGFAAFVGGVQAAIILTALYILIVGAYAAVYRLFADPLRTRRRRLVSYWVPRPPADLTIEGARRQ